MTSVAAQSYSHLSHSQAQARAGPIHTTVLSPTALSSWKEVSFFLRPSRASGCNRCETYSAMVGADGKGRKHCGGDLVIFTPFSADSSEAF